MRYQIYRSIGGKHWLIGVSDFMSSALTIMNDDFKLQSEIRPRKNVSVMINELVDGKEQHRGQLTVYYDPDFYEISGDRSFMADVFKHDREHHKGKRMPTMLPRRAIPQPQPALHAAGDCLSCVIAGLLDKPIEEVHRSIVAIGARSRPIWARVARYFGADVIDDRPIWPAAIYGPSANGLHGVAMASQWFNYVRLAINGGWYPMASTRFDRKPYEGTHATDVDHAVLIVGYKTREIRLSANDGRIAHEILVSCSATMPEGYWIEASEFLRYGGFDVCLVKPT